MRSPGCTGGTDDDDDDDDDVFEPVEPCRMSCDKVVASRQFGRPRWSFS